MGLTTVSGFFSYAHGDDAYGRLRMLKDDLVTEYKQLTGDELELFFDRDGLQWGDRWEANITKGIDSSSFFIPILSPLYFKSYNCETELRQFLGKVERESAAELLLPIYFVGLDHADFAVESELVKKVFEFQYEDWRGIRFAERDSERYRAAVGRLACRLAHANRDIQERSEHQKKDEANPSPDDTRCQTESGLEEVFSGEECEDDGFLIESTQKLTELSEKFVPHVNSFNKKMSEIDSLVRGYTDRMNVEGPKGPKAMTALLARLSAELDPVADSYLEEAEACTNVIVELDVTVHTVSSKWEELGALGFNDAGDTGYSVWANSLAEMVQAAEGARAPLGTFSNQISVLKGVSRVLYKPLRKIERANTLMDGVLETVSRWA